MVLEKVSPVILLTGVFQNFKEAAEKVKNLKQRPTDNEMLELYGLYKQSLEGDVNTDAPSFINITAKSKWNAWNSRKGMAKEKAMEEYVAFADRMISKYGL
ncbi:unnamed protein product [Calicophoron daubneyi]|uniref:ACB domain-containing protein n=1 Tax=Calicophoron daubneyi TaxID=300641 RepID=A0AAV2TPZ8_CALDB